MEALYADGGFPCRRNQLSRQQINTKSCQDTPGSSRTWTSIYIPPSSCHSSAVFKGFVQGIGTRLRMICSEDEELDRRLEEYGRHLTVSGWKYKTAKDRLVEGAKKDREKLLNQPRKRKDTKIAWVSTYDPRVPSKTAVIKKNLLLLHANVVTKEIFPPRTIISADRKEKISH